jgi:hypothetical protein
MKRGDLSEEQKEKMRRTTDTLSRTGERIQQSIALISDTEGVGGEIVSELARK